MSTMEITPAKEVIVIESINLDNDRTIHMSRPYNRWSEALKEAQDAVSYPLLHGVRLRVNLWMRYHGEEILVWHGEAE